MNELTVTMAATDCSPREAGYNEANLEKIDRHLKKLIMKKKITAGAFLLSKGGRIFAHRSLGTLRFDCENSQYKPDTIRWIASISKVFTSLAIIKLIENGLVHLHQPVSEIIDEFNNSMFGKITIFHLLTHSGGIRPDIGCMSEPYPRKPEWFDSKNWIIESLRDNIHFKPGTEWRYSTTGYCFLAEIVTRVSGVDYEKYVIDEIIHPLEMADTFFDVPVEKEDRICFANKSELEGYNKSKKRQPWMSPRGGGSLYSTLVDLQKLGQMLINKGTFRGKRIFGRKVIESMLREQFRGRNYTWASEGNVMEYGLGLNVYSNNTFLSPGSFSHEGAGLCGLYMDPVENFVFAYFCPLAEGTGWEIKAVINFRNMVWAGIV